MDHETKVEHLVHIAAAIRDLGDATVVNTLRQFVTLYHADSSFLEHEESLAVAAEAILRHGPKNPSEQFVQKVRDDPQTLPELKTMLRNILDPLAAATAEAEAKARAEAEAKAKAEAEARAAAEAAAKASIPDSLSREQISRVVASQQHLLKPCVQSALGYAPSLQSIRMRFVITGKTGKASDLRTLPNNIPGLTECLANGLGMIDFPEFKNLRQMATYTITIRAGYVPPGYRQPVAPTPAQPVDPDAFGGGGQRAPQPVPQPGAPQPVDPDAFQ
jgi:hypothetical protein